VQEHRDTSITIVAIGSNLKYKWEKSVNNGTSWNEISDDNILQGTDSDSLRIKNISLEMNGNQFRCLVSNACSPTNTSSTARVCVEFESPISIQPSNITVPERWDTAFTVTAIGSNLNYKWEMSVDHGKSWNLISDSSFQGTDSSRLKVKNISLEMNDYQFRCIVSNTCSNTDTSLIASLNAIFNSAEEFGINSGRITNYPNPARDEITICVEDQVRGNLMLRLLNLSGQEISISKFKKADDVLKCRMKVNELPAGVYIIQVFENEEMIGICKAIIGR
jgi:hypothetical protein